MKTLCSHSILAGLSKATRRQGQSIVEFALVVPVMVAILIAILEAGWMSKVYLSVANAAREGARSASLGKTTTEIRTRIKNAALPTRLTDDNIALQYSTDNGATYAYALADNGAQNSATSSSLLQVKVTIIHQPLTGFFPFLNHRNINVAVAIRREASSGQPSGQ